jgi:acrylyl-CoA reductase (NADPH)
MLCVNAMERAGLRSVVGQASCLSGCAPVTADASRDRQDACPTINVLVTGASGGVGSMAVHLLAQLGYHVVASTGRTNEAEYLKSLGASDVIDRAELSSPGKPLQKERWIAAVDTVGSHTLANVCAGTKERGWVTTCGMSQGLDFPATVAPFILRGITLIGIASSTTPMSDRLEAWPRLAKLVEPGKLACMTRTVQLGEAIQASEDLLAGKVRGRLVVQVSA